VGALAEAYPERRSLTVDVIDVYDYDEELVTALFDDPTHVLRQASDALRELRDAFGRVHVRVENNPELLGVDRLGAPHVHELVTVEGVVASVDAVETTAVKTVYECPNCNGSLVTRPLGIQLDEPHRCERCVRDGRFDLRHDRSTFADLQRVTFAQLPEDRPDDGAEDPRTVPVYLADDPSGPWRRTTSSSSRGSSG
jgi:replicative DNA helicase Mcm